MCDCGWDKRAEVTFSTLRGERDVARADAAEAERDHAETRDKLRILLRANAKLRGDRADLETDLRVERAEVARLETRVAGLLADAVEQSRRLDALLAQVDQ